MSEIEWLFYRLWLKPHTASITLNTHETFEKVKERRMNMKLVKFPFKVPETIVFKNGKPDSWYFRANDGVMLK